MYSYVVKIEVLRSGNIYYIHDISDDKELNQNYYSNLIQKFNFYDKENIKNSFDYLITIERTKIVNNYKE